MRSEEWEKRREGSFKVRSPSWGEEWLTRRNERRWAGAQWDETLRAIKDFGLPLKVTESFKETTGSILPRTVYHLYPPRCIREQLTHYTMPAWGANTFNELTEKGWLTLYLVTSFCYFSNHTAHSGKSKAELLYTKFYHTEGGSRAQWPHPLGWKFQLCHLQDAWPWASDLTFLSQLLPSISIIPSLYLPTNSKPWFI